MTDTELDKRVTRDFQQVWAKAYPDFPNPADDNQLYRTALSFFRVGYGMGGIQVLEEQARSATFSKRVSEQLATLLR